MSGLPEPIDPSNLPYLNGVFAPIDNEIVAADLSVVGKLPDDLRGVYLRNGPNPKFTPLGSYTYPFDGDGMIHGIWLADGRARYKNSYVLTKGLEAEIRAGRALWGGVMTPTNPSSSLIGPNQDPEGDKLLPSINVVRHAHRFFALGEGVGPYEVTEDLATTARCDFAGDLPLGMCAHPKIDPVTGEMILFRYGLDQPYLYWAVIGPAGRVSRTPQIIAEIDRGYMIHDFMITEDFVVLVINPAVFDLSRVAQGDSPLAWEHDRGTRIAVMPRQGGTTRWIETDAFWCWHYANAWQEGGEIVCVFPWWSHLYLGISAPRPTGQLVKARIDPLAGSFRVETLDDRPSEFPRVDDRMTGRSTRYVTVSHRNSQDLPPGAFDELIRFDLARGTAAVHRFPGQAIGEAVFAPKLGRTIEESGYVLTFATEVATMTSTFVVLDSENFSGEPVAVVKLPQRVPLGLHGNWYATET